MVTVTGSEIKGGFVDGASTPSSSAGFITPVPVANSTTTEPRAAGLDEEFAERSALFRIAPCPVPDELAEKMEGFASAIGKVVLKPMPLGPMMAICTDDCPATSNGTTALI